jgi:uncharacterized OB-fold protein
MSTTAGLPNEVMGAMDARLSMPYTLTAGAATGVFLAELAQQRIVGTRCSACETIRVPAQDFCGDCGGDAHDLVIVPASGDLLAWTVTDQGTVALVLLDGTDIPFLHQVVEGDQSTLSVGARVAAVWAAEPQGSVMDLLGFALAPNEPVHTVEDAGVTATPIEQLDYQMVLDYQHAYGHFYGSLFDGIKNDRRIRGVRCPSCRNVLVPPRAFCEACFVRTGEWVDVPDTGVLKACSVVHIEFIGQRVPPPYVYAEIILDGTSTRLIHTVGGLSAEDLRLGSVRPGLRVQAVWSDRRTGSLSDIDFFKVLDGPADE